MNLWFVADVVFLPCQGVEPDTWEWILKWCWLGDNAMAELAFGVSMAGMVGAALFAAMRQPKG